MKSNDLPFAKKRVIVLHEAHYECAICGGEAVEVDHIWPRNLGGSDDLDNLQAACRRCNARKGDSFFVQDITPARLDMFLPQLRERAAQAITYLARWQELRSALADGGTPGEDYYRLIKSDHPMYGPVAAEHVREALATIWRTLLHETPGQAALDALADLERFHLIDAEVVRLGDLTRTNQEVDQ